MFPSMIRYTVAPDPTKTSYTYLPALTHLVSVEPKDSVSPYQLDAVVSIPTVNVATGKAVDPIAVLFVI